VELEVTLALVKEKTLKLASGHQGVKEKTGER